MTPKQVLALSTWIAYAIFVVFLWGDLEILNLKGFTVFGQNELVLLPPALVVITAVTLYYLRKLAKAPEGSLPANQKIDWLRVALLVAAVVVALFVAFVFLVVYGYP